MCVCPFWQAQCRAVYLKITRGANTPREGPLGARRGTTPDAILLSGLRLCLHSSPFPLPFHSALRSAIQPLKPRLQLEKRVKSKRYTLSPHFPFSHPYGSRLSTCAPFSMREHRLSMSFLFAAEWRSVSFRPTAAILSLTKVEGWLVKQRVLESWGRSRCPPRGR